MELKSTLRAETVMHGVKVHIRRLLILRTRSVLGRGMSHQHSQGRSTFNFRTTTKAKTYLPSGQHGTSLAHVVIGQRGRTTGARLLMRG